MPDPAGERTDLLQTLREAGRLDLDLLVRDEDTDTALLMLGALEQELLRLLDEARLFRREALGRLVALERSLAAAWPGHAAAELLERVAAARRELAELDAALAPGHRLQDEVHRRTSRRSRGVARTPKVRPGRMVQADDESDAGRARGPGGRTG
jgi:hypothetical protein